MTKCCCNFAFYDAIRILVIVLLKFCHANKVPIDYQQYIDQILSSSDCVKVPRHVLIGWMVSTGQEMRREVDSGLICAVNKKAFVRAVETIAELAHREPMIDAACAFNQFSFSYRNEQFIYRARVVDAIRYAFEGNATADTDGVNTFLSKCYSRH